MIWTQFKILWPSFAGYWVFLIAVACVTYYAISKNFPRLTFNWSFPVTIATAAVVTIMGNTAFNGYQNMEIYKYQQANAAQNGQDPQASAAAPGAASKGGDPVLQMKSDFLKIVEQLAANPDQISDDTRAKLFTQYGKLFSKPDDKDNYFKNIMSVYQCQKFFWEDALASYQAKKEIKSEARGQCESAPGSFFNRDKLVTPDVAKGNTETINKLAGHKRLPAAEGKTVEVTEDMLRGALEKQISSMEGIKKVFQGQVAARK